MFVSSDLCQKKDAVGITDYSFKYRLFYTCMGLKAMYDDEKEKEDIHVNLAAMARY